MNTPAGWRKEDGSRDDLTGHQAWSVKHTSKPTFETACHCPYALTFSTWKDGNEWDSQTVTSYRCYMGSNRGRLCRSDRPICTEYMMMKTLPNSLYARLVATGLPST